MPIDGVGTDEEVSAPAKKKRDFEAQLMAGCSTIALVSLFTYFITIWPFASFPEYSLVGIVQIFLFGPLPASIMGAIAARKLALAGASGFFGGAMAAAVFMILRLQQTLLGNYTKDLPKPEYPDFVAYLIPCLWFVWAGAVALIFCRREPPEA